MANFAKENCRIVGAHLTSTANTDVFAATGYTQIIDIRCANITGTDATITVNWYSVQQTDQFRLIYQHVVPANGTITLPLEGFAPGAGDIIRLQAGTANAIDVVMTLTEVPGRMI